MVQARRVGVGTPCVCTVCTAECRCDSNMPAKEWMCCRCAGTTGKVSRKQEPCKECWGRELGTGDWMTFLIVGGFYSEVALQKREAEGTVRTPANLLNTSQT